MEAQEAVTTLADARRSEREGQSCISLGKFGDASRIGQAKIGVAARHKGRRNFYPLC